MIALKRSKLVEVFRKNSLPPEFQCEDWIIDHETGKRLMTVKAPGAPELICFEDSMIVWESEHSILYAVSQEDYWLHFEEYDAEAHEADSLGSLFKSMEPYQ